MASTWPPTRSATRSPRRSRTSDRTNGRVLTGRPRLQGAGDVVDEPGHLQLDVVGRIECEERRALQVVRDRGDHVVGDAPVVERSYEVVDRAERRWRHRASLAPDLACRFGPGQRLP